MGNNRARNISGNECVHNSIERPYQMLSEAVVERNILCLIDINKTKGCQMG